MMVLNGVVSFLLFLAQVVIVLGMGALSYFFFAGRLTAEVGITRGQWPHRPASTIKTAVV